jgi:hypothetical protein
VLAGQPPASTKGHFYWLKVAGGCRARQQKPVLAARTNRFWPSAGLLPSEGSELAPALSSVARLDPLPSASGELAGARRVRGPPLPVAPR